MKPITRLLVVILTLASARVASSQTLNITLDIFIQAAQVPIPLSGGDYAGGDDRSAGQTGTSRVIQGVDINTATDSVTQINGPTVGLTTRYNKDGTLDSQGYASTSTIQTSVVDTGTAIEITFSGNPTNPTVSMSPGITYTLTVTYNKSTNTASLTHVTHDTFPTFHIKIGGSTGYLFSETQVTNLIPTPTGDQEFVWVKEVPWAQNQDIYDFDDFMAAFINVPDGSGVLIGQPIPLEYQDSSGAWHEWEN